MEHSVIVAKLDAAKRQLETAIRLYFSLGDPVAIHTLAAAAYNIVRGINTKRGGSLMTVKEEAIEYAKPEFRAMLREKFNEAENFFKHADRDHDATLNFSPAATDFYIWDACAHYQKLTEERPPLFQTFIGWFMLNNEGMFDLPAGWPGARYLRLGRAAYFNEMLPIASRVM